MKEESWLYYYEIQIIILLERGFPEDFVSWTHEQIFSSGLVRYSEVNVDFSVYSKFEYWFHKWLLSGRYSEWGTIINQNSQGFHEWWGTIWCCYQIKENTIWSIWIRTPKVWNVLKWFFTSQIFVINVYPFLFISKTIICVVYVDYCLFGGFSKYFIDKVMIFSGRKGEVVIGNIWMKSQCLSYYVLTSIHWMIFYFSFTKLDWLTKSWKPQGWIILMCCLQPPRVR